MFEGTYCSLARSMVQFGPSIIFNTNQYERLHFFGVTPGIGHWLEIRDSLYMTTRRFTLAQQPGQILDILFDSGKTHAGRLLLLAPAQQARSITLRKCVRLCSVRIGRLNYILSLCSRANLLYIVTFAIF